MSEGIYRIFDSIWRLSLVGGYCILLVICCVHWFNPLVWLAFYLMNMDCEMSCDEKVVKLLGEESKKIYSYTLLEEASGGEWKRYRGGSICGTWMAADSGSAWRPRMVSPGGLS
ncbi:MAG: hypothetical protein J6B69_02615 [Lachnospiraceae bacterium]|nr:hypothetical protein [Lachnospiraceae bacterium]